MKFDKSAFVKVAPSVEVDGNVLTGLLGGGRQLLAAFEDIYTVPVLLVFVSVTADVVFVFCEEDAVKELLMLLPQLILKKSKHVKNHGINDLKMALIVVSQVGYDV